MSSDGDQETLQTPLLIWNLQYNYIAIAVILYAQIW